MNQQLQTWEGVNTQSLVVSAHQTVRKGGDSCNRGRRLNFVTPQRLLTSSQFKGGDGLAKEGRFETLAFKRGRGATPFSKWKDTGQA